MNYRIITIVVLFILLLLLGYLMLNRSLKRKKLVEDVIQNGIPKEILQDFEYAEKQMKGGVNYGEPNYKAPDPYAILWEIAKRNRIREASRISTESDNSISNRKLPTEPIRREDFQNRIVTELNKNSTGINRFKGNGNPNFFSRFRRK